MNREHYQTKAARDERAAELRRLRRPNVRKSSSRGSIISPDYITDYVGFSAPNGFGGRAPQYFAVLYTVEWGY